MSENQTQPQFALKRVYLKDASLETPAAPQVFTKAWQPEVNLDINTRSTSLDEQHFEVVLSLTVTVKNEGEAAFLVEVQQAGIFLLAGLGEAEAKHTLGAFCPNLLFPYAREAIDNLASKASFPALMLAPVNFDALYAQQLQQAQANGGETH
ncbi:Protein export cytoplasm chaperone protein (SecB, maintains protein to be exported in unfolded state) [Marinobacterium lacunae]|uniref:Protein-export protein SecB n=1 Tax=Marinobacterium lacunae TaxID=1232683 RepID=A0A081FYK9_9GAMM|nr:protein-export chaperone SecB [Marinobacterium lacunae]KEA63614.1 Protein export cytoplasm chaperone protein (SecB, maintains protein to be exported in unfolded state) [Marinobacterium lacunae]MBR9885820.1 protein-export chaperone SecB [Oceanospirillales bacterium]